MPFTINGIGTCYYGKRHAHTIKSVCEFCGKYADLASFDTTLFFVAIFVPLIPLSKKRILRQCSVCQKHRALGLAQWEEAKERDTSEILEKIQSNPPNRDLAMQAIGYALAYQDEPLFDRVVETLDSAHANDALVLAQVGDAYSFFARWPEAEEAYLGALDVEDSEPIREQLAWALLKQSRPDEAQPYLEHVLAKQKRAAAGFVYHLINGYQAQGRHDEAQALIERRDQAFPELAATKEYQRQRKTALRYQGSDEKVRTPLFIDSTGGYREGNWTARWPYWIAALLLLGATALYLGSAFWIGRARNVYLVNGTNKPYTAVVQGSEHLVAAHRAMPIHVAEGDVEVSIKGAAVKPIQGRIETSFWTRPFASHTFVINPDEGAIVLEEEEFFAAVNPKLGAPPKVHIGHGFYSFAGIDYEFQEFPRTITVSEHGQVRKTRVALAPAVSPEMRLSLLMGLQPAEQMEVCKRSLDLDPSSTLDLYWLCNQLPPEEGIAFLEPRLNDFPILVDWHRMYQSLMERAHPEKDLRPRYRKLLAKNEGNADALYLLGRADPDLNEQSKLFQKAAAAKPPSGFANYALGYHALSDGRFADAIRWYEKALQLLNDKIIVQPMYHDALLANGDYARLLALLQADAQAPGRKAIASFQMVRVHALRGDRAKAQAQIDEVVKFLPAPARDTTRKALEAIVCCSANDVAGYLKLTDDTNYEAALLRGKLKEAAALTGGANLTGGINTDRLNLHGLVYLEAVQAGAKEIADAQWKALLAELKKTGRDYRLFADYLEGRQPPATRLAQRLPIEPNAKRVLLAVAAQRLPEQKQELLALAKRLDFYRDAVSLCLAKFLK